MDNSKFFEASVLFRLGFRIYSRISGYLLGDYLNDILVMHRVSEANSLRIEFNARTLSFYFE